MVRGKGKFGKVARGGGRRFSKDVENNGRRAPSELNPLIVEEEGDNDLEEEDSEESEEEDSEEESSEEESSEEEAGTSVATEQPLGRRRDMKMKQAEAKQTPEAGDVDEDLINPNHVQHKMTISDLNTPRQLTRREREQKEKQEAKDRYWKLHVQGKTDEAKADLSRLAKIRAEREAAQAKRRAETEAKATEAEAKKKAQLAKRTSRGTT